MRLFLAIDLPQKTKKDLSDQISELKLDKPDFQWVSQKNYHITLFYYGETNNLKKIKKELKDILYDQESFHLYSAKADLFITTKILIYLGFYREKKIEELEEKIRQKFGNFQKEVKFIPHLTLARCRIPSKQQYFVLKKKLSKLNIEIDFPVKKLILFESILGGKFPVYKKIAEFSLLQV